MSPKTQAPDTHFGSDFYLSSHGEIRLHPTIRNALDCFVHLTIHLTPKPGTLGVSAALLKKIRATIAAGAKGVPIDQDSWHIMDRFDIDVHPIAGNRMAYSDVNREVTFKVAA